MEHAWKACIRDKRIVGSNPTSSECNEEEATQQFVLRGSKSRDEIMLPP